MPYGRLNFFENFPPSDVAAGIGNGSLQLHGIYIPGSISFNNIALIFSNNVTINTGSLSISFGLYSLNGATLSLANSASVSTTASTSHISWLTLATSATQDITPGMWWFAYVSSTAGTSPLSVIINSSGMNVNSGSIEGAFVRGFFSTSTGALPASIATSDCTQEGGANVVGSPAYPYMVIGA